MLTTDEIMALCAAGGVSFIIEQHQAMIAGRCMGYFTFDSPNEALNELWHLYCEHGVQKASHYVEAMRMDADGNISIGTP